MGNLLRAVKNIINCTSINVEELNNGSNRAHNMGEGLEKFIKNAFSDTMNIDNEYERMPIYERVFAHQGNKNHPPDLVIRGGDAIEVKKIEGKNSGLALNSSFPKSKLHCTDTRISAACRTCEEWTIKDILYTVGYINKSDKKLKSLWFVYGDCYAASKSFYEKIADGISNGLREIPDIEFAETNELGGVKKVDPLGITDLRIRGMWHIQNPSKVFQYIPKQQQDSGFQIHCLMRTEKYNSFSQEDRTAVEQLDSLRITDVRIKNPDNPVQLIDCKFLEYYLG